MTFLKEELQRPGNNLTTPCVQMPRIRFGNQESLASEMKGRGNSNSDNVPVGINASGLQTLRWRHHASPNNYLANRISKTMIDLSRVAWEDLVPVSSIHRPIRAMCGQRRLHIQKHEQVFAINHYLGSWEQYTYRDDSRTGKERSEEVRCPVGSGERLCAVPTDVAACWICRFSQRMDPSCFFVSSHLAKVPNGQWKPTTISHCGSLALQRARDTITLWNSCAESANWNDRFDVSKRR